MNPGDLVWVYVSKQKPVEGVVSFAYPDRDYVTVTTILGQGLYSIRGLYNRPADREKLIARIQKDAETLKAYAEELKHG